MGMLNRFLRVKNCSWCHKSFLWGRVQLPFHLVWVNQSHGICNSCSRNLVREMNRCQTVSEGLGQELHMLSQDLHLGENRGSFLAMTGGPGSPLAQQRSKRLVQQIKSCYRTSESALSG